MSKNFLIHKPKKSIILPYSEELLTTIPKSREFSFGGKQLLQIYHGLEETKVLNNLGYQVPSPILYYYDWPLIKGKFKPFEHQTETAAFMVDNKRGIVLDEMGTGKTCAALWAADYLMKLGVVRKVGILSPLSTLSRVWADEIFNVLPDRNCNVLYGDAAKRKTLLKQDVDFHILNHHGVAVLHKELLLKSDIDMWIFDEASVLRNGTTDMYKKFQSIIKPTTRLYLLTGTPCPNGPEGAWSLARLISPERVPKFFGSWKRSVMVQISQWKYVPTQDAHLKVHEALQPSIRHAKADCLDLLPQTIQKRECELSDVQKKAYKEMRKEMQLELKNGTVINAVNGADRLLKCIQIFGGAVKNSEGVYTELDIQPRLNALLEIIEEANKKIIVFSDFTGSLRGIVKNLKKHNITCEYVDGSVSQNERDRIFSDFQNTKHPQILVANSRVASHGLTLTAADTIVWWTSPFSLDRFLQANARVDRPSQDSKTTVILLGSTALEWSIYNNLLELHNLQEKILDLYKIVSDE